MSIKIASKIWDLRGLTIAAKLILVKLADCADDSGKCWPSISSLSDDCEVDERTVYRTLKWAEERNLIVRESRPGRATIYRLTPDNYNPCQNVTPDIDDKTPGTVSPPPLTLTTPTPDIDDTAYIEEPSKEEPSFEPSKENRQAMVANLDFERFWEAFPRQRRGSRDKALPAYMKALKKTSEEKIHEAVIRYSSSRDVERGFAKGAAAWLNDEGWDYQLPTPSSSGGKASGPTTYERAIFAGVMCSDV